MRSHNNVSQLLVSQKKLNAFSLPVINLVFICDTLQQLVRTAHITTYRMYGFSLAEKGSRDSLPGGILNSMFTFRLQCLVKELPIL